MNLRVSLSMLITAWGVCFAVPGATYAAAQGTDYPTKAIRLVVPFAPGGSNDIMARIVAQQFTESMKQQVVVDNRAGASGIIGTEIVAKAPPDGYTVLIMSLTFAVNPSLHRNLPFRTDKDLAAITLVASAPLMLVVNPSVPAKSLKELVQAEIRKWAKVVQAAGPKVE